MTTIADSDVIIAILQGDPMWGDWSERKVAELSAAQPLVVNQVVIAELAPGYGDRRALEAALSPVVFRREELPWEAAFEAGQAFAAYRRSGGNKRSPLPDFYIGAHASVRGYRLLTRDAGRYRAYFPALEIISPETHP